MKANLNFHFTVKDFVFYFKCQRAQRNGQKLQTDSTNCGTVGYPEGVGCSNPPRNSEVLTKLYFIANWMENV